MATLHFNRELFAEKLKAYRDDKSQTDIASELNVGRSTISLLENGKQDPTLETLNQVCQKINQDLNTFFKEEQEDPVLLLMGQLKSSDKDNLVEVMERIKIREHYIAIDRRGGH
ncbi:hypothetical protein GCM10028778_22850 [Barrientosiimonas marina]|uniref:Helix-turn-helix domain-containing protein n=1 Tax=Lentibacillus kimchii TaxID=1542911 RepID=A0ABW2UW79_9BACI